jgi:hypothetical protein
MYRENKPITLSPYDHPDIYPGPRPVSSFLFQNGIAHRIEEGHTSIEESMIHISKNEHMYGSFLYSSDATISVKDFLKSNGLAPIKDRVPVLAYGSNVCLAQLIYKSSINSTVSDVFLCFRAMIKDTDVVYGALLAPYGALPAIIAPVPEALTEVWVTFLDREQLEHMHKTEKGYEFRVHKGNKINLFVEEQLTNVYAYFYDKALTIENTYFRFPDIPGTSSLPSIWQADMLSRLKDMYGFEGTREGFIHLLRWDYSFRNTIKQKISEHEKVLVHPDWEEAVEILTLKEIMRKN